MSTKLLLGMIPLHSPLPPGAIQSQAEPVTAWQAARLKAEFELQRLQRKVEDMDGRLGAGRKPAAKAGK